jgi:DNA-directed RNA polymerase subunit RPC12/RpoP
MLRFCGECVQEKIKTKTIKGKEITYTGREAYCSKCGSEIFVPEVRNYNLKEIDKAYRKEENSVKDIE